MPATRPPTLDVVRRAVRSVVQRTPELEHRPDLRRRIAENMVGVSLAAAELIDAERRMDGRIAEAAGARPAVPPQAVAEPESAAAGPEPPDDTAPQSAPVATGQAAGDIHRRTAVNSAAGVLQATRRAIDFPGFVTSLVTGVFQAMTTSTIQQLEAYANLLESVNTSASAFAASSITPGRAATWVTGHFAQFVITPGDDARLALREGSEMPEPAALKAALDATDDEVSLVEEDDLEGTLLPLVSRKLARDRQSMLATMVLMGMNRVVVDQGRIEASMELEVDARSTAEQTEADRFDTRVNTAASGSFGAGMWGASASLSATVGYVRSDQQFTREDIRLRAGLRSKVDIGFHTEPIQLDRMARPSQVRRIQSTSRVPETERRIDLLATEEARRTQANLGAEPPAPPTAPDPGSAEQRRLRARRNFGPTGSGGSSGGSGSGSSGGSGSGSSGASGSGGSGSGSSGSGSSGASGSGGSSGGSGTGGRGSSGGSGTGGRGSSGGSGASSGGGGGSGSGGSGASGSGGSSGSSGSGGSGASGSSGSGGSGASGSGGSGGGGASGSGGSGGSGSSGTPASGP